LRAKGVRTKGNRKGRRFFGKRRAPQLKAQVKNRGDRTERGKSIDALKRAPVGGGVVGEKGSSRKKLSRRRDYGEENA